MNPNPPFTPEQQKLIEAVAGLVIALACWQGLKVFHPWSRDGKNFSYTSAGVAIFLFLTAADFSLVAWYFEFVPRHPMVLPTLPMIGCFAVLVGDRLDNWRKKKTEAESPQRELPIVESLAGERMLVRAAVWYARVLGISLAMTVFSFYGSLFGPQPSALLNIGAVMLVLVVFMLARQPLGVRFLKLLPEGLSGRFSQLKKLQIPMQHALVVGVFSASCAIVILFATTLGKGGPDSNTPVFAAREQYWFTQRSAKTEVSAVRYWVAGTATATAFNGAIFTSTVLAIYGLVFGRFPNELIEKWQRRFP
jgi:hypothetical protein